MPRSAAAKSADRLVCRACKLPVAGAKDHKAVVWLGIGPVHAACHAAMRAAVEKVIAAALAAGTHTTAPAVRVCHGCRQWRPLWHKAPDGTELCRDCTPEAAR